MSPAIDVSDSAAVHALDEAWFTAVLSHEHPAIEVRRVELADVIQGASVKLRFRLEYDAAGDARGLPESLIVKGSFGRHNPRMATPLVLNELRAYRDIVSTTQVDSPRLFFAGEDPQGVPVIVMEDLLLRHVRFNSSPNSLRYPEIESLVTGLARLHATWWSPEGSPTPAVLSEVRSVYDGVVGTLLRSALQPQYWNSFMRLPRAAGLPRQFKDPATMLVALQRVEESHRTGAQTVLHGDSHVGNTYQNVDGSGGFYDWTVMRGPWQHDIAYLIPNAVDVVDRRAWERPLLAHYLDKLRAFGVREPPSFEQAWLAYRQDILYGLLVWMANGDDQGQFQAESINAAGSFKHAIAALDHDTIGLLTT